MATATSGTVSLTKFDTGTLIDHAFRRTKLAPQQITNEYLQTARDILYLLLSAYSNKGLALWCIEEHILPLYTARQTVPCPLGTVDVLNCNLRQLMRPEGTATSSQGTAQYAFDSDLETACTQTTPAGEITLEYAVDTQIEQYGILPNVTALWDIEIQTSLDGTTWLTVYADTAYAAVAGEWQWFYLEGQTPVKYIRLQANGTTVLDVIEFYGGNNPEDIPLAKINRDDYQNLSNKSFLGRPVQFWYNKQFEIPELLVWPAPQLEYTFYQVILTSQQYIQDVGSLTQSIAVPQRWKLAIICDLASHLCREIPEVAPDRMPICDADAVKYLNDAWAGETDSSPTKITPNISPYTR